jgi:hypothetical protein
MQIKNLDLVVISGWIKNHELLTNLVENLIESPRKAFMRDWYQFVVDLEEQMKIAASRTLQDHVARLHDKDARTGAKAKTAVLKPQLCLGCVCGRTSRYISVTVAARCLNITSYVTSEDRVAILIRRGATARRAFSRRLLHPYGIHRMPLLALTRTTPIHPSSSRQ